VEKRAGEASQSSPAQGSSRPRPVSHRASRGASEPIKRMHHRSLLRHFDLTDAEDQQLLEDIVPDDWLPPEAERFEVNKVVKGHVLGIVGDDLLVDVGCKSEGLIPIQEWYDERAVPPRVGDPVKVLLDSVEDESGAVVLSFRKARQQEAWEEFLARSQEG